MNKKIEQTLSIILFLCIKISDELIVNLKKKNPTIKKDIPDKMYLILFIFFPIGHYLLY